MALGKSMNYFETLIKTIGFANDAAKLMYETLASFNPAELPARLNAMHEIEHRADEARHEIMARIARDFITPIEREDIAHLADVVDDLTDAIEEVLLRLYMYNIRSIRAEAMTFAQLVVDCCAALSKAFVEFQKFKKSAALHGHIVEVNRLEELGDNAYTAAIRELYVLDDSPLTVMAWTQIINQLEECCDACEEVANVIENVVMKNT